MVNEGEIDLPPFVSFTKTYHNKPYPSISPTRAELSAAGKNVVVVGGGSGIGQATATAFAQAGAASVSILGRRVGKLEEAAKEIEQAGNGKTKAYYAGADFSDPESAKAGLNAIAEKAGGKIDIFVWSAGILPTVAPISGYSLDEFRRALDINVIGPFNALQAVFPLLASDATVINISTGIAHMAPIHAMFNYATTKLAVTKIFDSVAAENKGLRVFNVQPGVIATELNADTGVVSDDVPELPAEFSVWLASPEAEFLRGKFMWANWDVEELVERKDEIEKSMLLRVALNGVPM